jgi:hypothetical protein
VAEGMSEAKMFDVARVSDRNLIGEIIEMRGYKASIQVYEETGAMFQIDRLAPEFFKMRLFDTTNGIQHIISKE